jgi:hypothetical protein
MMLTLPDSHVLSEIDTELGPDSPCSLTFVKSRVPFCDKPAEWACQLACCGSVKVVCHDHRDIVGSVLPRVFLCVACGAEAPLIARTWRI